MGSGIAAQVANSGHEVVLLDIAETNSQNKNGIVQRALDRMLTQKPAQLSHPSKMKFIAIGNLEDNLELIKECDLVIEVIIEKLDIKHDLYRKITPYLKPTAILCSNTSTLLLRDLKRILPEEIAVKFMITHFFNPPRVMELLELITDEQTSPSAIKLIELFMTYGMGKTIVRCNDTPGFIANRIGCFLLEMVVRQAIEKNLDIVTIDNIFSQFFKLPSTGIFGLYDLIGHDVMQLISESLMNELLASDAYYKIYKKLPALDEMLKQKLIGRKGPGGFYRLSVGEGGKKIKEVIDPQTLTYKPVSTPKAEFHEISGNSAYEQFINEIMVDFCLYICNLIPEVTDNPNDVDKAIELGYGWKHGPFAILKTLSIEWFEKELASRSIPVPEVLKQVSSSAKPKLQSEKILDSDYACLFKQNDNLILDIKNKMGVLSIGVFNQILKSIDYAESTNRDIFIYPSGKNFSAGADLKFISELITRKDFEALKDYIALGQKVMMRIKYASSNVISCARGVALGGGCEILLHSDYVLAHLDLTAGLVEMSVRLIPGWGGFKEMILRSEGDKLKLVKYIQNILTQNKSSSSDYFVGDYGIQNLTLMMHKNKLIPEGIETNFPKKQLKEPAKIKLPDVDLLEEFNNLLKSPLHENVISSLNQLLKNKELSEQDLLEFEQEKFLELAKSPSTLDKIHSVIM
jgi:3-hydroxyacyl-CoA dehydrogenase/enoyl-CoA hydratase/3-hydroxybutyryl-CoA epimerase